MSALTVQAPAKLNLFLAITGRRADGFHDLVSVVAPLAFGDTLAAVPSAGFSLACTDPEVPVDGSNLVLKAAAAFARATAGRPGAVPGAAFALEKRTPMGAGLGGGSSDAVAALRLLQALSGRGGLSAEEMAAVAAGLGSDCPLFLREAPVVMRGRGERVGELPASAVARIRGRRVLVFKPGFGISTPWAYGRLVASAPGGYLPAAEAEARLAAWLADAAAPLENLLFNNMEPPAFRKFLALRLMLERLSGEFGLAARMSGSGSACFTLLPESVEVAPILAVIRAGWGESAWAVETRLA